jgi:glycosyltransferase involved in cell wall biosynthesis
VSIVTPSFNQGEFIGDTILSIFNQDHINIEQIIVDGGSTDNTESIVNRYANKYNISYTSEPDEGQSDAINKGFDKTRGVIVGWLNSDDVYFYNDVISYVVKQFELNEDIDVLYGHCMNIDKNGKILRLSKSPAWSINKLLRGNYISQPATFFRSNVVKENKLDTRLHLAMDYEYWLRVSRNHKFKKINKIVAGFRVYHGSKSQIESDKQILEEQNIMRKYGQQFGVDFKIGEISDSISKSLRKLSGIEEMIKLGEKNNLAFKHQIPPFSERIVTQIPLLSKLIKN